MIYEMRYYANKSAWEDEDENYVMIWENKDKNSHAYSSFFGYEVCSYDKRITKADIMKEFKKIIG